MVKNVVAELCSPLETVGMASCKTMVLVGNAGLASARIVLDSFCERPKTVLAVVGITYLSYKTLGKYAELERYFNCTYEFVPVEEDQNRNVLVRYTRNTLRFAGALARYRIISYGGYFPPSIQQLSSIIEESVTRKDDLRPLLVPAGDSIDIFPCNSIHSHPRSAEFRSSANAYLNESVRKAGFEPYNVSASRRDVGDKNRFFYCSKDFGMQYKNDKVSANSAIVMTDVDYYADMPRWLRLFKPICMYSLVPESLNYSSGEYSYRFDGNEVIYDVAGGGSYKHQLWDYKGDTVTAIDLDGNLLIYDIEQRKIKGDNQHRLIWLLPKAKITDPLWITLWIDWPERFLKRKVVSVGNFNILWEPIDDKLSVSKIGSKYSVSVSGKLYEAIRTRLQCKDSAPFVSDVERMLKEAKHEDYIKDAPILFHCFSDEVIARANVVKTGSFPTTFQALPRTGGLTTEDAGMPGQVTSTPLVSQPALFASKGHNADISCIEGRIDKVANHKRFPPKYRGYANEFVHLLVPQRFVGKGVPLSMGEVRASQDKKAQRGRFNQVAPMMTTDVENKIRAFIKTEPYASAKPPRNISTMSPEITIQSSTFSIPMANVLKTHDWYCPGKKPREIVRRLADVMLMEPDYDLEEGDYTCLDGTQSADYSDLLLLPAYMRYYAPEHRAEYRRLHKQIYVNKASTSTGFSYKPRTTVRSGSSITTQAGTIDNAFNVYCALRNMGYDPEKAWSLIGAIFGDDSVNAIHGGIFREHIEQVANTLGMIYKSNLRPRNEAILFLGRYFINPLTSDDSFADPLRTISKLHVSTNKTVTHEQAAANKAHGYHTTDAITPIIGTWANRVLSITKLKFKNGSGEEQYKCSNAWPQRDHVAIREAMAKVLGWTVAELMIQDKAVEEATGLDQFPVIIDTVYKHTQVAVVDGDLVGTDLHSTETSQDERQSAPSDPSVQPPAQQASCSSGNAGRPATDRPPKGNRTPKTSRNTRKRDTQRLPRANVSNGVTTANVTTAPKQRRNGRKPKVSTGSAPLTSAP